MENSHIIKQLDLAHMGMSELKKNELKLLTPYLVNDQHAVMLFPVKDIVSTVKLSNDCARRFRLSANSTLRFKRCQRVLNADKCHISYKSENEISRSAVECFLKGRLSNNYITLGGRELFKVMGNLVEVRYEKMMCQEDSFLASNSDEEDLVSNLTALSLTTEGKKDVDFIDIDFTVSEDTEDSLAFRCSRDTEFVVNSRSETQSETSERPDITLFGLDSQKQLLQKFMDKILISELSNCLEHTVLICGPPGCGKSLLARWCLSNPKYSPIELNKHQLTSKYFGEAEKKLEKLFEEAKSRLPAILLIDRIDEQFPHHDDKGGHANAIDDRLSAIVVQQIDALKKKPLIIIGTSSDPANMNKSLRVAFGKELFVPLPSPDIRREIFLHSLEDRKIEISENTKEAAMKQLHGYSGADIIRFTRAALEIALCRDDNSLRAADFVAARSAVPPAGLRGLVSDTEAVHWGDIGGMQSLKNELQQLLHVPLSRPEVYRQFQLRIPAGVLLYGPPGCCKTMMAKALATETGLSFVSLNPSDLFKRFVGESESLMRSVVMRARAAAPAILFIDEIDTLLPTRSDSGDNPVSDRILAELLTGLDGVAGRAQICLLGATNRPDKLDAALLRPGRMDRMIYVPLPDADTRRGILNVHLSRLNLCLSADDEKQLVERTEGYSGAEVVSVVQRAKHVAMEDFLRPEGRRKAEVTVTDLRKALDTVRPRTSIEQLQLYQRFEAKGLE